MDNDLPNGVPAALLPRSRRIFKRLFSLATTSIRPLATVANATPQTMAAGFSEDEMRVAQEACGLCLDLLTLLRAWDAHEGIDPEEPL